MPDILRSQQNRVMAKGLADHLQIGEWRVERDITRLIEPGKPGNDVVRQLCRDGYGAGGVLGLDVGSEDAANQLMERLQNGYRFGYMAVSLGYFDTLMSCSGSSTSSELSEADKASAGISPGYIRISIGYTGSLEQRLAQLRGALGEVGLLS